MFLVVKQSTFGGKYQAVAKEIQMPKAEWRRGRFVTCGVGAGCDLWGRRRVLTCMPALEGGGRGEEGGDQEEAAEHLLCLQEKQIEEGANKY